MFLFNHPYFEGGQKVQGVSRPIYAHSHVSLMLSLHLASDSPKVAGSLICHVIGVRFKFRVTVVREGNTLVHSLQHQEI